MAERGDGEKGERRFLQGTMGSMPVFTKGIVASVVAVGVATTAVGVATTALAPLDRVIILFQTGRTEFQSVGLWGSVKKIAKMEGLRGLYKGNGVNIARIVPLIASYRMAYTEVGEVLC